MEIVPQTEIHVRGHGRELPENPTAAERFPHVLGRLDWVQEVHVPAGVSYVGEWFPSSSVRRGEIDASGTAGASK